MSLRTATNGMAALGAVAICATGASIAAQSSAARPATARERVPPVTIEYLAEQEALLVGRADTRGDRPGIRLETASPGQQAAAELFARLPDIAAGAPIAVVRDEASGFAVGDVFVAGGRPGELLRIQEGRTERPWLTIPAEQDVISALHVDRTGGFDRELIAASAGGNVWQIGSNRRVSLVAATGVHLVAVITVPAMPERYGPWSGAILAASDLPACRMVVISADGRVSFTNIGVCIADFDLVAPRSALYGIAESALPDRRPRITEVPAEDLAGRECAIAYAASDGVPGTLSWASAAPVALPLRVAAKLRAVTFPVAENLCQPEICGDGVDNNNDGSVDERCREVCDGVDNDGDGEIDEGCADPCGDGVDDDGNGVVDDNCVEICGDHVDNDGDGSVDTPCAESCGDTLDNDGDGVVDNGCPLAPADRGCSAEVWAAQPALPGGVARTSTIGAVFAITAEERADLAGLTVGDALRSTSHVPDRALLREGVAALLSATSPAVGYPIRSDRLLAQVRDVLISRSEARMRSLERVLRALNAAGCSLK
ncbi:MAG: hypothetical protein HYU53_09940 [Acidobacteria bacterium]|nr:hypothetical protein [Acidobacteriota bacterium]